MWIKIFLITINLYLIVAEGPIVETTHGKVRGKTMKSLLKNVEYYGFMGIPFAKPPVGELRFLAPQPVDPWHEILVATKEKKACIQSHTRILDGYPMGNDGTEDCLYLDIFTPNVDSDMRSVIVFIFNEHFTSSYNKTKDYAPDFFIEEDVIVITLSHRLSAFGFLSLENDIVPGNAGLKDIVAALEWTKANINRFGGNPNKITLMGAQGGAVAVDLLMNSNSKHLFRSVIMQGKTSWGSQFLQEGIRERAFKVGKLLNRESTSNSVLLKDLNELNAFDIIGVEIQANPPDYFKETQRGILTFGPIVEKHPEGLITQYPEDSNETINIPIMIGFNSREGLQASLQYLTEPRYMTFIEKDFPFLMPIRLRFKFDPMQENFYDAIDEIKRFYFKDGKARIKSVPEFITYLGDVISGYQVNYAAKIYSKRSSNSVFYYNFDYFSELNKIKNAVLKHSIVNEGTWGAASGDELCYLFYCPGFRQLYLSHNEKMSEEIIMLKKIVKMWANFAKFGNPTPEGDEALNGLEWPKYDIDTKKYLHIDSKMEVKSDLYNDRFKFWDDILQKWEAKAVEGTVTDETNKRDELYTKLFSVRQTYRYKHNSKYKVILI